jgi:hypothetical protein
VRNYLTLLNYLYFILITQTCPFWAQF